MEHKMEDFRHSPDGEWVDSQNFFSSEYSVKSVVLNLGIQEK